MIYWLFVLTTLIIYAHVFIRSLIYYGFSAYKLYIDILNFVLYIIRIFRLGVVECLILNIF